MKEYTKEEIDDMREMLANSEWGGGENMPDKETVENWENIYGDWED